MPTLPPASDFTAPTVTEGGFKTAITNQREFLADLLGTTGTKATALATLGAPLNAVSSKSAAYTVVAADRGLLINCTGTWTLSLTAAATLGAGFTFAVKNSGTGAITIDPAGSELIDGATTLTLAAGESAFVQCDGAAWRTVSKAGGAVASDGEFRSFQVFTASGTWTKPAGLKRVKVTVVGGGGGSGGARYNVDTGAGGATGGGGGGGAAIKVIETASLGATETVTVGAGGTAGASTPTNGGTGGTSSFGTHCSATGGVGSNGANGQSTPGGAGGIGVGGNLNIAGKPGKHFVSPRGGDSGSTILSGEALGGTSSGLTGIIYGGGASGAFAGYMNQYSGAAGAAGVVIVEEFF